MLSSANNKMLLLLHYPGIKLYKERLHPYFRFILWNAVTSIGENKVI